MLWKLPGRAVMLSVEFATPGVLGQHGSSCEISAALPEHSRRAEVCCRDDGDHWDLHAVDMEWF